MKSQKCDRIQMKATATWALYVPTLLLFILLHKMVPALEFVDGTSFWGRQTTFTSFCTIRIIEITTLLSEGDMHGNLLGRQKSFQFVSASICHT